MNTSSHVVNKAKSYISLMRLKSIDVVLLPLVPSWCGIIMAVESIAQAYYFFFLFFIGAIVMRTAGCVINDIFDHKFDKEVHRTKGRPIASGALTINDALILLSLLFSIALLLLLTTNFTTVLIGIVCGILTVAYPLFKRFFWWPQLILGITFNCGALMGWSVIRDNLGAEAWLLYFGCIFWTLSYDTIYAHQDKIDDVKLNLRSTAIRFGENSRSWIGKFFTITEMFWLSMGVKMGVNYLFYCAMLLISVIFFYQYKKLNFDNPKVCMYMFRISSIVPILLFLGILFGKFKF